jgi:DNA modification methylase
MASAAPGTADPAATAPRVHTEDPDFVLWNGDVIETLQQMADASVHCVVTSPPYFGLRDYQTGTWHGGDADCDHARPVSTMNQGFNARWGQGEGQRKQETKSAGQYAGECPKCGALRVDQQLGLEPSHDCAGWATGDPCGACYVCRMVAVFREVRRVLRDDGVLWLNIGDSYATQSGKGANVPQTKNPAADYSDAAPHRAGPLPGVQAKGMVGVPWRLAFALQADGWHLRSDVIWWKRNPLPESIRDRPTKAHEYIFLLAKSQRYFYDVDAVREPFTTNAERPSAPQPEPMFGDGEAPRGPDGRRKTAHDHSTSSSHDNHAQIGDGRERWPNAAGRQSRTVWDIPTQPYSDAHFAVFPEELVRRCIALGTSERGCCPECGKPWERQIEKVATGRVRDRAKGGLGTKVRRETHGLEAVEGQFQEGVEYRTTGWRPGCACHGPDLRPILTPTGGRSGDDPTMTAGRAGMGRPRGDGEGVRPITVYEQQAYAAQLRDSPHRVQMEEEAGPDAFAHYLRTDEAGARPVPPVLLAAWAERGWIEYVAVPDADPPPPVPCTVLDPFMGSGTTALVARKLGRRSVGIDLNAEYCDQIARRLAQQSLFA